MYKAKVLLEKVVKSSRWKIYAQAKISKSVEYSQRYYTTSTNVETFSNSHSSQYIEDMYNTWLENPASVHAVSVLANKQINFIQWNYMISISTIFSIGF